MTSNNFDFNFDMSAMQVDLNRVDQKPGQMSNKYSDKYVVMPKGEGSVTIRILPPNTPKGKSLPYASTRLHYLNDNSFHCLRELSNGKWVGNCPICNYYNFLYKSAESVSNNDQANMIKAKAKGFKPVERYYYNCIVRKEIDSETGEVRHNVGPKIWAAGKSLHGRVLRAFCGNKKFDQKPLGNIAHPMTGRDFKIIKKISRGDGMEYPNYDESTFLDECVLGDNEQIKSWLETMFDLDAERTDFLKSYEDLKHQIDIIEGKVKDNSQGYDPDEFSLPEELKVKFGGSSTSVSQPTQSKPYQSQVSKPSNVDVPFEINIDDDSGVEDEWVKDLQKKLNLS